MPLYENVTILRQDVSTAQVEQLTEQFVQIVAANGGAVPKKEYWGLRNLAYRIKKNRKGHYLLLNLDAPPAAVAELERNLRLNEDVLRTLSFRVEALEEGPSAMMQAKTSRDERERGDRMDRGDRGPRRDDDRPRRRDFERRERDNTEEGAAS
ncbi:MAG: 30S ribosomal protein S6 [Alphaproteobacteria bacterium]|nr:30S ribosomal protein S6 [Alphaproteobacteria bacterium]